VSTLHLQVRRHRRRGCAQRGDAQNPQERHHRVRSRRPHRRYHRHLRRAKGREKQIGLGLGSVDGEEGGRWTRTRTRSSRASPTKRNLLIFFRGKNIPHKLNEKSVNSRNRNRKKILNQSRKERTNQEKTILNQSRKEKQGPIKKKQSSISQEKKNKDLLLLWPIEDATEDQGDEYKKKIF
jgi:hypothetical protein